MSPGDPRRRDERSLPVVTGDGRSPDPETLRHPPPAPGDAASGHAVAGSAAVGHAGEEQSAGQRNGLEECVADLQRVKAEYDNFRKRVQRDRASLQEIAVANVLRGLLPVLDSIAEARQYGEVTGGFRSVVEVLEDQLGALGLQGFGEPGEPFDPERHEALSHVPSDEFDGPTCTRVVRRGYRVGGHLLRPAQVTVAGPALTDER